MRPDPTPTVALPTASTVIFRLLGPLQVLVDGRPLILPGAKPRAALAALLVNRNRVVGAGALIAAVWNDDPPAAAATSLQVAVARVRRTFRTAGVDDPVETAPPGYRLTAGPAQVDVDQFVELRRRARGAQAAGDFSTAAALFRQALLCWSGEPLADLRGLRFADEFAAAWDEERLATVGDRIDCDLRSGRHEELIGELVGLTGAHPLRESLWAQLISALYRSGRQADALDAARRVRAVLADELGIDPGPELQDLTRRVLRQEPEAVPARPADPAASLSRTITDPDGAPRAVLVDGTGRAHPVTSRGTRIGRMPDGDVVLDSGKVSRRHAVVIDTGGAFVLTDLNSTNGTAVGGRRIFGATEVDDGDVIVVGDVPLTLRVTRGADAADPDP